MSSTNRSNIRSEHKEDYYVTPLWWIREFLNIFIKDKNLNLNNLKILDPCAGGDEKNEMSYPKVLKEYWVKDNQIDTIDIRNDSKAKFKWVNFLQDDLTKYIWNKKYDIIITNPPFYLSQSIIEKSLELVEEWWYVIMLLRLNYVGSKQRVNFWKNNRVYRIYAHSKRMKFTENWNSDSIEYWHFVRKKWYNLTEAKFKILETL